MPQERTAAPLSGFFKFTKIGQKAVGRVSQYRTSDNGAFIVMSPICLWQSKASEGEKYQAASVGLSTDLGLKINIRDVGKFLSIEYVDAEPTRKGSNKKLFRVQELNRAELVAAVAGASEEHRGEVYSLASANDDEGAAPGAVTDNDDDLPF
jgi:hypothetical protein